MGSIVALRPTTSVGRGKGGVAQVRQLESLGLPEQMREAACGPIRHCLLHGCLFQSGIGTLILARGSSPDRLAMIGLLLDVFCLGIKDIVFESIGADDFKAYVDVAAMAAPLRPVDPAYARSLLHDLAAWSHSIGLPPHPDFAMVEIMFGGVAADACDAVFQFGKDGRPLYVPGPSESPMQIRRRLQQLRKRLGDDGFEFAGQGA